MNVKECQRSQSLGMFMWLKEVVVINLKTIPPTKIEVCYNGQTSNEIKQTVMFILKEV